MAQTSPAANRWQTILADAFQDMDQLLAWLDLTHQALGLDPLLTKHFPLRATKRFVDKIQKGDPCDPLLQQILPTAAEHLKTPDYETDPLAEHRCNPHPGMLHKYYGRLLLILTGACAIHCRFCFRQHFSYQSNNFWQTGGQVLNHYLKMHPDIDEVILSGGDPLLVDDKKLFNLCQWLADIPTVRYLRLHTRVPVVLPERLTAELLKLLTSSRLQVILVIHCNHPQELDQDILQALQQFSQCITVLNQTVLLRHVNDDPGVLVLLNKTLFKAKVLPYYLHLPDKTQGTQHFAVSSEEAQKIMWHLTTHLPGYLVPKLVFEQPGKPAKIPIAIDPKFMA